MSDQSKIEWTDASWNPVRGCSRVSEGCRNCYAERQAARFSERKPIMDDRGEGGITRAENHGPFFYFAAMTPAGPRWTGEVALIQSKLDEPLRWKKPRRIFVNSMSDLFHEKLSVEEIAKVFSVMGGAWWHTYQILTKRPERMAAVLPEVSAIMQSEGRAPLGPVWKHVWLGVSVEDQATADERIPLLLQTPAALRFVSYEPALGPVDFVRHLWRPMHGLGPADFERKEGIDWIIVGGESGPGARPFDVAWARSAVAQCKAAGVPVFVKQLGARPLFHSRPGEPAAAPCNGECCRIRSRKGGDPAEWPEDLRVREFPAVRAVREGK